MADPGGKTAAEFLVEAERALRALWGALDGHAPQAQHATSYAEAHAACVPLVAGNEQWARELLDACLEVGDPIAQYLPWIRREAALTTHDSCDYCPAPHEYRETHQGRARKACAHCAALLTNNDHYRPTDQLKGLIPTR